ncbi:MAG: response regulator, partial [Bacteroidetes bacterium]|nr:response regulator [Bacteroidota bacterium]
MRNKIKIIIIDDESLSREITKEYLSAKNNIEIAAECSNGFEAIKKINELKPDLIFLDIQMPKLNGFEVLELLDDHPVIIFTTAYDNFAIKAFEVNAADYLLKPFSEERFNEALQKAFVHLADKEKQKEIIKNLIEHNYKETDYLERVVIKKGKKVSIIPSEQIKWLEAQDDYVMIHTEKEKYLKNKTMKYFEQHLDPNFFIRIHRSHLISVDYIQHLEQTEK